MSAGMTPVDTLLNDRSASVSDKAERLSPERVLDTPYGYTHVVRYSNGCFWVDRSIRFERKRVALRKPIRGLSHRPLLRRVIP